MAAIVDKYPQVFKGIRKVKIKPIYIHLRENNKRAIAQKPQTVALHLKESLRQHLEELKCGGVVEEVEELYSAVGCIHKMMIEAKK